MGNEKKRGIKGKIWDFRGVKNGGSPLREIEKLEGVLRKSKGGGEGEEIDAEGRSVILTYTAASSNQSAVRCKT